MKIVNQNAVLVPQDSFEGPYEFIERVGRTCYKSEDKIEPGSAAKFVTGLAKSHHHAMLEFGYIYMTITYMARREIMQIMSMVLPHVNLTRDCYLNISGRFISGSFRAFYDFFKLTVIARGLYGFYVPHTIRLMYTQIVKEYPEIFDTDILKSLYIPNAILQGNTEIIERNELIDMTKDHYKSHANLRLMNLIPHAVLFTTDRGVSHELVRHRPCSFAQESTRYCNYSKGKFGQEITVIEPSFFEKGSPNYSAWKTACMASEIGYFAMINEGATAQEARTVLPNSLKTDIWMMATESEWQHVINLRYHGTTGAPHPQMKELMTIAYPQLVEASEGRLQ